MLELAPRWRPAERAAAVTAILQLGLDLLALLALAYLWVRLRSMGPGAERRQGLAEVGLHTREWGRNVLFGLGGYAAALPLVIGSGILASWLGRRFFPDVAPPFHPIQAMTAAAPGGWVRFALLLVVVVGAPVLEEIFFRGLLHGGLRRRFGVATGIVGSATVFSLLHPQLPLGFLPIFVLAAVFAVLYEWRQSLVPGMVMHAVNNGMIWIYLNVLFPPG
jgi:membrane protease YdiL (CAAX protease family)